MTKNEKRVPTSKSALHRVAAAERMKERQMQVKTVCDGVHFAFFGMFPRLPAERVFDRCAYCGLKGA